MVRTVVNPCVISDATNNRLVPVSLRVTSRNACPHVAALDAGDQGQDLFGRSESSK